MEGPLVAAGALWSICIGVVIFAALLAVEVAVALEACSAKRPGAKFPGSASACSPLAGTIVNPYGVRVHEKVFEFFSSPVFLHVIEHAPLELHRAGRLLIRRCHGALSRGLRHQATRSRWRDIAIVVFASLALAGHRNLPLWHRCCGRCAEAIAYLTARWRR